MRLLIMKALGGGELKKRAKNGPLTRPAPSNRGCPPDSMVRVGWVESWGEAEGGGAVSGLGGVGYGDEKIFYVGVNALGGCAPGAENSSIGPLVVEPAAQSPERCCR